MFFFRIYCIIFEFKSKPASMRIIEVNDRKSLKAFYKVPSIIYKGDSNYVPQLRNSVEEIFSDEKNALFKSGNAARWVLMDHKNNPLGRIAAFF